MEKGSYTITKYSLYKPQWIGELKMLICIYKSCMHISLWDRKQNRMLILLRWIRSYKKTPHYNFTAVGRISMWIMSLSVEWQWGVEFAYTGTIWNYNGNWTGKISAQMIYMNAKLLDCKPNGEDRLTAKWGREDITEWPCRICAYTV
jgi:hypothetical protein